MTRMYRTAVLRIGVEFAAAGFAIGGALALHDGHFSWGVTLLYIAVQNAVNRIVLALESRP